MATLAQAWQRVVRNDQLLLFFLAVVVGAAAGYGALLFRLVTAAVQLLFFGHGADYLVSAAAALPWWQIMLAPAVGGLLIGLLIRYVLPGRLPQGVADVIEASALKNGRMPLPDGLGATLGSYVARRLHLSPPLAQTLLGCGVASAIASAFNAPIAGVFFALEVVIGHYGLGAFSPVVISSVIGTVITRIHIGRDPAFILPPQHVVSFLEIPAFVLLGLVSALAAMALLRGIAWVQAAHDALSVPPWLRPAVAGLL
jgi:chloride channel protein, CIC family